MGRGDGAQLSTLLPPFQGEGWDGGWMPALGKSPLINLATRPYCPALYFTTLALSPSITTLGS
jgi:hypothetical protein